MFRMIMTPQVAIFGMGYFGDKVTPCSLCQLVMVVDVLVSDRLVEYSLVLCVLFL